MIKVEITKEAIEYLSEHLGYGANNLEAVEEIAQIFIGLCRLTSTPEGEGGKDRIWQAAQWLVAYYEENGESAFRQQYGGLEVLDEARKIIAEGEGNPHPWPTNSEHSA